MSRLAAFGAIALGLLALQEALVPESGVRLGAHLDVACLRASIARLSFPALFGAGVLVGLCTVPCSGTVYLALLGLASSRPLYRAAGRWQLHHRSTLKLSTGVVAIGVGLLTLAMV